jgi:hypothetical protein
MPAASLIRFLVVVRRPRRRPFPFVTCRDPTEAQHVVTQLAQLHIAAEVEERRIEINADSCRNVARERLARKYRQTEEYDDGFESTADCTE